MPVAIKNTIVKSRLMRPLVDWYDAPPPLTIKGVAIGAVAFAATVALCFWIGGQFGKQRVIGEFEAKAQMMREKIAAEARAKQAELDAKIIQMRAQEAIARAERERLAEEAEKAAVRAVETSTDGIWTQDVIKELNR